jgi:hypothetical protein
MSEKPLCCQINDALLEVGGERVKEIVQAMVDAGISADEINAALQAEIVPQFEDWRIDKLNEILTMINGNNETKH